MSKLFTFIWAAFHSRATCHCFVLRKLAGMLQACSMHQIHLLALVIVRDFQGS